MASTVSVTTARKRASVQMVHVTISTAGARGTGVARGGTELRVVTVGNRRLNYTRKDFLSVDVK